MRTSCTRPSRAWDALLDPAVLVATIPGCERLVATGENSYDMTVTAGVAAIKGTYAGTCVLSDLDEPHVAGDGAQRRRRARHHRRDGQRRLRRGRRHHRGHLDADAVVGGMVGGVGQRMLTSVSKRMAGEFFGNVDKALSGRACRAPALRRAPRRPGAASRAGLHGPALVAGISSQSDFVKGIAVGAGLVLLGVVAGSLFGRRR